MTLPSSRRLLQLHGIVTELFARTKWTIWCYDRDHMPVMIDLLIANGILRESDRPNCVHWTSIRGEREPLSEDLAKILDADAMLHAAGVQTLVGQLAKASRQGPEALNALYREWYID